MKVKSIKWSSRYSETMDDDKFGRWARIGYCGDFINIFDKDGKPMLYEIAWIKKLKDPITEVFLNKFVISLSIPTKGELVFDKLEDAIKSVEESFNSFISNCIEE